MFSSVRERFQARVVQGGLFVDTRLSFSAYRDGSRHRTASGELLQRCAEPTTAQLGRRDACHKILDLARGCSDLLARSVEDRPDLALGSATEPSQVRPGALQHPEVVSEFLRSALSLPVS